MRKIIVSILFVAVSAFAVAARAPQAASSCDRACLSGFITKYLDALIAHKPGDLPTAANVRFTEDSREIKLGEGLWKTASKLTDYRQEILDARQGVAGVHTILEESGTKTMLVARLKIVDKKVTEIETMVVHNETEGMIFKIDALKTATPAMNALPEKAKLNTREEAIRIATLYPGGLKVGSFVRSDVPFAPEAYRFENGQLMAGPGCTFIAGCDKIKTQGIPTLSGITYRVGAVDEEQGIVWLRMDFGAGSVMAGGGGGRGRGAPGGPGAPRGAGAPGAPGAPRGAGAPGAPAGVGAPRGAGAPGVPGAARGAGAPGAPAGAGAPRGAGAPGATGAAAQESLNCWEMFKVYGGEVHAVEAFMKKMPLGTPTGWEGK